MGPFFFQRIWRRVKDSSKKHPIYLAF